MSFKKMTAGVTLAASCAFAAACAQPVTKSRSVELDCITSHFSGKIEYNYTKRRFGAGEASVRFKFSNTYEGYLETPSVAITNAEPTLEIVESNGWTCRDSTGQVVPPKVKF